MAQVKIIQPIAQQATKIRVAAYARVSSNSEDQLNSFATQVEHYTKLIEANADWVFADIYADAAITGTRADKRNEFQRLLQDCRAGKIDRVLVKSISRFARNTVDCIETVRELSLLDIAVAFEKENIDTSAMGGEMLLSMLGAAAQEESLSISQNLQWGIQRRMRKGEFVASTAPYGYERKGISLVPNPQQASNVKFIFDEYLTGKSSDQIALFLNQQSISAPNGTQWYARTVRSFLTNEKYKGDMLLQKQFTTDCLPLRRQVNRGERPQFYASQTHEPIITEDVFDTVQALLCSRNKKHAYKDEYKQYPFSRLLICGHCGTTFRRGTRKNGIVIWTCRNHFVDQCKCPMLPVLETDIHRAFLCLYHKLLINYSHLLSPILEALEIAIPKVANERSNFELHKKTSELLTQNHALSRLLSKGYIDNAAFVEKSNAINQTLMQLRLELKRHSNESILDAFFHKTQTLYIFLEDCEPSIEFSPTLFAQLVHGITIQEDWLQFELTNGLRCSERIKGYG